ncbi:MAG: hypothetical protein IPJ21_14990 [Sterolibacteriaceae bacterium]|nr:hypothetical protein [Sterolibacteriaceae bacterium]MBK9085084.1 hypothetical protein [Sterolibacteriaceae bacterium]
MKRQLTLVSLYGDKHRDLAALIAECQQLAFEAVGAAFTPYDIRQIHATIVGLERRGPAACNANFSKHRGEDVAMDFAGFLACLRACECIPFEVQLGGFARRDEPFTSRKAVPYERSFSVQGDKVVVMGWPVRGEPRSAPPAASAATRREAPIYPPTLDLIRRTAQRYGILHAYHRAETDVDNDLFFRIGLVDPEAMTAPATRALEHRARQLMSARPPLVIGIRLEDIYVAAYEDERLPLSSTRTWSLADPGVTGDFVAGLA